MNNKEQREFLSTDVNILFSARYRGKHRLNSMGIYTVQNLLDYSWGFFKPLYLIGPKTQDTLFHSFAQANFDLDQYYVDLPPETPILQTPCTSWLAASKKSELLFLTPKDICLLAIMDEPFYRRILKVRESLNHTLPAGDKYIWDIEDMPKYMKEKLILSRSGCGTYFELLSLRRDELLRFRNIGETTADSFLKWQKGHSKEDCK